MPFAGQGQPFGFDMSAISIVSISISAMLGLFLIIAWLQERDTRALAWWGAAYLIGASAIALWSAPAPLLPLPEPLSGVMIFVACGMVWNGVRLFHGRKISWSATIGGGFVWLVCLQFPLFSSQSGGSATLGALIVAIYTFFIAFELWRERRKTVMSRTAALAVPLMHAAMFIGPLFLKNVRLYGESDGWLIIFALETMIYSVGTAFIVLLMVKDHHVHVQRTAASIDPLTGLFNRRAFGTNAEAMRLLRKRQRAGVSILLFDLDKFKRINDTFGHAMGDEVLRLFAATLRSTMRADDIIARLGGEEIAAIVPGNDELAAKIAERVRKTFEGAGVHVGGQDVHATVSVGIACDPLATSGIEQLMHRADEALYRAKATGRNRICIAGKGEDTADGGTPAVEPAPGLVPLIIESDTVVAVPARPDAALADERAG